MELGGKIILNEVTQAQKDKYRTYSLICECQFLSQQEASYNPYNHRGSLENKKLGENGLISLRRLDE